MRTRLDITLHRGSVADPCRAGFKRDAVWRGKLWVFQVGSWTSDRQTATNMKINCLETPATERIWPQNGPKAHRRRIIKVGQFNPTRVHVSQFVHTRQLRDAINWHYSLLIIKNRYGITGYVTIYIMTSIAIKFVAFSLIFATFRPNYLIISVLWLLLYYHHLYLHIAVYNLKQKECFNKDGSPLLKGGRKQRASWQALHNLCKPLS